MIKLNKHQDPTIYGLQEVQFGFKDTNRLKVKGEKERKSCILQAATIRKREWFYQYQTKQTLTQKTSAKEGQFIMTTGSIHQKDRPDLQICN